ncbi:putative zinc-type alcohol dehydrogenase-like protein [Hymenobacter luteus]|uniref:Zinc-type alcohol dehydrogenase-like protein n=2 Tax=Hymenobacter TaxID=89966 RepID=A0ABR6JSH7_9BACT|nr:MULTISPECIES: NAD(P)-dependent alcohol dehydrogenase [Hymenobacter]MBB4599768.1 putative zinc-type alcohol dehydrogenase-like protein [Hymenobacter latericoloratus]MBB6057922.1 putative zinc-type alcohol dehydrogenase-like protein [Hymenobacter luteus]
METIQAKGYGASNSIFNGLSEMKFERHAPKEDEVHIEVLYCGVCHSDLHQVKNDWKNTIYPCVPGHEVIGRVVRAGSAVTTFQVGDVVGVGCMIDSCGTCAPCQEKEENYCEGPVSWTATYNGYMKPDGSGYNTYGGYSTDIVVKESFVLRIPEALDIKAVAPILCAGVTTYAPLKHWKIGPGHKVGVVGLGGLGHMAVQLAAALGAEVTVITSSEEKQGDAAKLGARHVILSTDKKAVEQHELTLDFILSTIPDSYDINDYVNLLRRDGTIVTVGLLGEYKKPLNNMDVAMHRRSVAGSIIGSIQETQEVLDFCAQHHILPEVEMIPIQDINKAFDKMQDEEVHYRYVIDMQSLKEPA